MKKCLVTKYLLGAAAAALTVFFTGCASEPTVFYLIKEGRTKEAQAYFTGKAALNERDENGRTALHVAAEAGNEDMVRFLLAMGTEADTEDNQGRTALGIASGRGDPAIARLLTAAGAGIHHPLSNDSSETPALLGVRSGGLLLDALILPETVNTRGAGGVTLLHLAGQEGNAAAAGRIAAAGGRINERDDTGKTALDYALSATGSPGLPEQAAETRYAETAEQLILAGGYSSNPFYTYLAPAVRSSNYNIRLADGYTVLHYAALEGYLGYITFILDKKADINIKNNSGSTPLHEASRKGRLEAMKLLISRGAEVNVQDAKGNSPLHLAIPPEQHEEAVQILLARDANPKLRDEHGETPLHVVITLGRPKEIVAALLAGGSDVSSRNIDGKTALYLAVETGRTDLIPLLLEYHSDIFAADNGGITPLEKALKENNPPVLEVLLTEETVQQSDSAGNTPLHIAVKNRIDVGIIENILNKHGVVNARNKEGNTALHIANIVNHESAGTLLISRGADIFASNSNGENPLYLAFHLPGGIREWMLTQKTLEAQDGLGNTALHYAAQWKLAAHVPLLVRKGSKPEAANATGETPLFMAAKANSPETIRALLGAGASVHARDSLGNSPLHSAVRWNAQNSVDPLISAGNSVNAQNLAGKSPLHEAVRLGLTSSETMLISRRANIEIRDTQGNTPLMEAVQGGFPGAVERLTEAGADPVTRNNSGDTPLHIAVTTQRTDLVTILLNSGAPIHARNSQGITPFQIALGTSSVMVSTLLTKDRILVADDDGLSPLHIAVKEGAPPVMIQIIINRGGRISSVDSEGRTPLRLALDLDALEGAKILADAGSDVFAPAADGRTPASAALSKGERAVRALFSGAAINARDGTGNTVLHYAAQTGSTALIGILLELGANKNIRNIASESPADIALRWNHHDAAALLSPVGM
ncbi:MAG: ankyrin repeat domain-containing protein [Treponema sp.]|jgi:ankyrin repeat protein|nr:ankyrin repeat domain-containing protein [Treponema sp.]